MGCIQSSTAQHLPDTFQRNLCAHHHDDVNVFDFYKVVKELGHGAFGVVNLVEHIGTADQYAMKVITIGPNGKLPVLRKEMDLWRGLQHPNIVRLVETYETPKHIYMIMELCTGGHMLNYVNEKKLPFPESEAKNLIRKLASCLYYLHLKNICHRDVKLENILFERSQSGSDIKLCDFGASTLFREGVMMQTVLGSVVYMAPEVLEGHYTQACDMWSLGVIMYMFLTNRMPFYGATDDELVESILSSEIDYEHEDLKNVSTDGKNLLRKLLNRDTSTRYTAAQVLIHPWIKSAPIVEIPYDEIDTVMIKLSEYASFGRMKRAALLAVAFCLPSVESLHSRRVFDQLNVLHNGVLTLKDLQQASLVEKYPHVDFPKIFACLDMEGTNQVNYLEFISATLSPSVLENERLLKMAFSLFDSNETGMITETDLQKLLGCEFDEAAIKEMIKVGDSDKNGTLNFKEFMTILQQTNTKRPLVTTLKQNSRSQNEFIDVEISAKV